MSFPDVVPPVAYWEGAVTVDGALVKLGTTHVGVIVVAVAGGW